MGESLFLMAVGMLVVFVVLLLVVGLGKLIILFVNKYVPEEVKRAANNTTTSSVVDAKTYAVISSAVSTVTDGKGTVVDVEKI